MRQGIAVALFGVGLAAVRRRTEERSRTRYAMSYETWIKVEPPGVVCGNNTPYKFFVNYTDKSDNLVVVLEPGGACWDYDSCTGNNGIRGAANVDGLPDDHYKLAPFISPFLNRSTDTETPTADWNYVYVPVLHRRRPHRQQRRDVHRRERRRPASSSTTTATTRSSRSRRGSTATSRTCRSCSSPAARPAASARSSTTTSSATASTSVKKGYMLDDSGPVFPSSGYSAPLHAKIRSAWNVDSIGADLPPGFTFDDMGTINTALADEFPDDRLATTYFRRDMDFSLYSYERFYNFPPKEEILRMWDADTQLLDGSSTTRATTSTTSSRTGATSTTATARRCSRSPARISRSRT